MVRRIRDRHARMLTGKKTAEIIAFYRVAGEAAIQDARVGKPVHTDRQCFVGN